MKKFLIFFSFIFVVNITNAKANNMIKFEKVGFDK